VGSSRSMEVSSPQENGRRMVFEAMPGKPLQEVQPTTSGTSAAILFEAMLRVSELPAPPPPPLPQLLLTCVCKSQHLHSLCSPAHNDHQQAPCLPSTPPPPFPSSPHRSGASTVSSAWNSVGPSYQGHTSGVALSRTLWPCRALMGMKVRSFLGLYPADLRKGVSPLTISSYLCARVGERECVRA
jgi:hypothetical protein